MTNTSRPLRFVCCALSGLLAAVSAHAADLEIEIKGIKSRDGGLRIAIFDSKETFLDLDKLAAGIQMDLKVVENLDSVVVRVKGLAPGSYAVSTFHDENGNQKNDRNMLGIPSEGYGFSQAPGGSPGRFGPPGFEDAAIEVGAEPVSISIPLKY